MIEANVVLARRLVACKSWRWMPGMRSVPTEGMITAPLRLTDDHDWPHDLGLRSPDLTDPATLGCLLALVREAWGMPTGITVSYSSDDGLWGVSWSGATHGGWCGRGKTEAEALVASLEAAP